MTFIRSLSWKEWLALIVIAVWHVAAGWTYGPVGLAIGLGLGLCVSVALVMAFRILAGADRKKKNADQP